MKVNCCQILSTKILHLETLKLVLLLSLVLARTKITSQTYIACGILLTVDHFINHYGRATQLADRGPNPDLSSVKAGPQASG